MRAHCITFYDDRDKYVGDIWLSSPGDVQKLRLDVSGMSRYPVIELSQSHVALLLAAITAFLEEKATA